MTLPVFPKPSQKEGKITLNRRQRKAKLDALCIAQKWLCAYCGCRMTAKPFHLNSATLDHITVEPMGCAKRDNDDNLCAACAKCNSEKGSKRL